MQRTLREIAELVGGRVIGDAEAVVRGVASPVSAQTGDLVFVEEESYLQPALTCAASAVMAGEFAAKAARGKALIVVENPRLAFARAAALLSPTRERVGGVHDSAVVLASAKLGAGVSVDARAVIAADAVIGAGSWIGVGVVVGRGVRVGERCEIYPNVTLYSGTVLGDRVVIHAGAVLGSDGFGYVRDAKSGQYEKFPQIGSLRVEDDVEIGANATIDRGALDTTVIGRGTKIDNLVHVGHNVRIGEDVVIAAQTGVSGSAVIESGVIVAGQVGIADHVRVESGAILGAQCGVPSKKVIRGKGVVFWGTPARPIREYLKELAAVARLAKKR
jgi:UDP-3-O-[3-hydroxymyristoyl] glucosamine N-acyltransferase